MRRLDETKTFYKNDVVAKQQIYDIFGNCCTEEFDIFWESLVPQAIKVHNRYGMGQWAGSGCVDYNEALALYLFVRSIKPETIIELGYAGGISTSVLAFGCELNGFGNVYTVDLSPEFWDVCDSFTIYKQKRIIIQHHTTDAVDFLKTFNVPAQFTFTDATHEYKPTKDIAELLRDKNPDTVHAYHEWGMSHRSGEEEKSYVSMKNHIGMHYERDAFETTFGENYRHGGFVGSCGLGVVMPL